MKHMMINNRKVAFDDEKNILAVVKKAGIELPTFCYHSELSTYGACRMCVVEDDRGKIFASCSEPPRDGMVIYTNTPRLRHHRKVILELLLASHCRECTTCRTNGECILLKYANQLGVNYIRFENNKPIIPLDFSSNAIVIDRNKCILCGDCVRTCKELQGVGVLTFAKRGAKTIVTTAFDTPMGETRCVGCGQCRIACPTGAITIHQNIHPIWEALSDPKIKVVAQIAPAVRVAVGRKFDINSGENMAGKIVAAMRRIGFDEIYDTNFAADLTVIEESAEFVEKLTKNEGLPLFTSCCPGWVKFCEDNYPEFADHISTCRSPQQMFGALYKEKDRVVPDEDGRKTVLVSIMPCTAKKNEIERPEHYTFGEKNVDYVVTTTELIRMIKEAGIDLNDIPSEAMDMPYGISSGGGAIFGVTGGVTEAVVRRVVDSCEPEDIREISHMGMRGNEKIKEMILPVGGRDVKVAVVNGLANVREILDDMRNGIVKYDFVEVMACRNGCICGGGQPLPVDRDIKKERTKSIYNIDRELPIRTSNYNPFVDMVYEKLLEGKEHEILHNDPAMYARNNKEEIEE